MPEGVNIPQKSGNRVQWTAELIMQNAEVGMQNLKLFTEN